MSDNNVVEFPSLEKKVPSAKEVKEKLKESRIEQLTELTEIFSAELLHLIVTSGIEVDDEDQKSFIMVSEAMRSMLFGIYDIEHPFQVIADNCFEKNEEGNLVFHPPLFGTFKDEEKPQE